MLLDPNATRGPRRRRARWAASLALVGISACHAHAGDPEVGPRLDPVPSELPRARHRPEKTPAKTPEHTTLGSTEQAELGHRRSPVSGAETWHMPAADPRSLPRWIRHHTLPRETIEQLASRYGVHPDKLRAWNKMDAGAQPHPWRPKSLRVHARRAPPAREALEHLVSAGDSWAGIARHYAVDSRALRAWNVARVGRSLEPEEQLQVWIDPVVYDGVVHDAPASPRAAEVRAGAHGVGTPQAGVLVAGVQIPEGEGYALRYPNSAWGTTWAVRHVVAALDRFAATSTYPLPIRVGTMSRQRGGEIGGHNSHQSGRDLDIRLPLRPQVPQALPPTNRRVDWGATWELVRAFADQGLVSVIFLDYGCQGRLYNAAREAGANEEALAALLQYPRGSRASGGIVKHAPGHADHIHVRFPCGPREPECLD